MPKFGQARIGASWYGDKEPDIIAPGRLRFYDKRCRTRIITAAIASGSIAKNSIFQVWPGNGKYGSVKGRLYQKHYKYFRNIGAPGSDQAAWQAIFKTAMDEVKALTEEQRAPYKALAIAYKEKYIDKPGSYRARSWFHFYLIERLPVLYPGYP